MKEFLSFGGYGFYILSSYIAAAIVIVLELAALRARMRRARTLAARRAPPESKTR